MRERGHDAAGDGLAVNRRAGNGVNAHILRVDELLGELGELLVVHEHVLAALAHGDAHKLLILDGVDDLERIMQALNHDGVVAIRGLSPRSSSAAAEGRGQLGTAAQHGIHRGTAGADRLMQVGAVLVQVADQGADFAGGVETLDRLAVPVENLTLDGPARSSPSW